MKSQKVMNHLQANNLKNKMKITSLNLYQDKKEEILDSKSLMLKDNLYIILIIIMENRKAHLGQRQKKKNIKVKNSWNINFVKSILLSNKTKKLK